MTVMYAPMVAIVAWVMGLILANLHGTPEWTAHVTAAAVFVAYWYSPLPDSNGGIAAPTADNGRCWGFSRDD